MATCTLDLLNKIWRMCPSNILPFKLLDGCWILNFICQRIPSRAARKTPKVWRNITKLGLGTSNWHVHIWPKQLGMYVRGESALSAILRAQEKSYRRRKAQKKSHSKKVLATLFWNLTSLTNRTWIFPHTTQQ